MSDFHKKLVALREERKITQEDFANDLEVSRTAVSSWERGKSVPTKKNIQRICDYFGVSPDYFYGEDAATKSNGVRKKAIRISRRVAKISGCVLFGFILISQTMLFFSRIFQEIWNVPQADRFIGGSVATNYEKIPIAILYFSTWLIFLLSLGLYAAFRFRQKKERRETAQACGDKWWLLEISEKLKNLRREKNISQEEFSKATGWSRQTISNWESGKNVPGKENLVRISEYFGVSQEYFYSPFMEESAAAEGERRYARRQKKFAFCAALFGALLGAATVFWHAVFTIVYFGSFFSLKGGSWQFCLENTPRITVLATGKTYSIAPQMITNDLFVCACLFLVVFALTVLFAVCAKRSGSGKLGARKEKRKTTVLEDKTERNGGLYYMKKGSIVLSLAALTVAATMPFMANHAPVASETDTAVAVKAESARAFTNISLEISGGNGEVVATATNTFTLLVSTVQVYVELYYSSTYTTDYETMTMPTMAYTPDLDMGHSLSVDAKTNGEQRYWLARVRYNENGSGWQEIITGPVLLDANGNAV